jgi:hypothetical protein
MTALLEIALLLDCNLGTLPWSRTVRSLFFK